MDLSRYSKI